MTLASEISPRSKSRGKAQKEERQSKKYEREIGHSGH